jgi:hypothetical protein
LHPKSRNKDHDAIGAQDGAISSPRKGKNMLDLPNELLRLIFQSVKGVVGDFYDYDDDDEDQIRYSGQWAANTASIKNIRLTCRRFHANSSHLLIHRIDVSLTEQSLARLEDIVRHSLIGKGVTTVRIDARFYADNFGRDRDGLASLMLRELEWENV